MVNFIQVDWRSPYVVNIFVQGYQSEAIKQLTAVCITPKLTIQHGKGLASTMREFWIKMRNLESHVTYNPPIKWQGSTHNIEPTVMHRTSYLSQDYNLQPSCESDFPVFTISSLPQRSIKQHNLEYILEKIYNSYVKTALVSSNQEHKILISRLITQSAMPF